MRDTMREKRLQDQVGLVRPLGRVGGQSGGSGLTWGRQTLSERFLWSRLSSAIWS